MYTLVGVRARENVPTIHFLKNFGYRRTYLNSFVVARYCESESLRTGPIKFIRNTLDSRARDCADRFNEHDQLRTKPATETRAVVRRDLTNFSRKMVCDRFRLERRLVLPTEH
jgi:hypothetical protein